jgi:hypothetical protein
MSSNSATARPFSWPLALLFFLVAYVIVTVLAAASTEVYRHIYQVPYAHELGVGLLEDPAFAATVPFHVLIMLLVWPAFAWLFLRSRGAQSTRPLAWAWLAAAVVVDFLGFVAIEHPWSLTTREFYVDYQPWITLIYAAIFASPWIGFALVRRGARSGR